MTTQTAEIISDAQELAEDIILYGAGDTGKAVLEILESTKAYKVIGFVDDNAHNHIENYPILGSGKDLKYLFSKGSKNLVVTISKDLSKRIDIANQAKIMGFHLPIIIHPLAKISRNIEIGEGSIFLEFSSVAPDAKINRLSIIKPYARVAYSAEIGEGSLISPYGYVGSYAKIGTKTIMLTKSSIEARFSTGDNCIISPNTYVNVNVPSDSVAYGNPVAIKPR